MEAIPLQCTSKAASGANVGGICAEYLRLSNGLYIIRLEFQVSIISKTQKDNNLRGY